MTNIQSQTEQNRYYDTTLPLTDAAMTDKSADRQAEILVSLMKKITLNRDKLAFEKLFIYFVPKIKAYGLQRLNQQGLALDLVQETMASVWTKSHLYNSDKGSVTTWVFTIMRNQCFDMLRRVQSNKEETFGDDIWPLIDTAMTHDSPQDHKFTAVLQHHLDDLPFAQRQVVQGIYMQELTQQELASALNVPVGTIKSRLRLGLEKLKGYMETHND